MITPTCVVQISSYAHTYSQCPKPVIAAVHSACVGGGVDMITACDIRLCSGDAWFQVKVCSLHVGAMVTRCSFKGS